jgi:uncharacterized membrane protein YkvA (DUF1232 family)
MWACESLQARARRLKRLTLTVYFAARDPHTPIMVRILAAMIAAYALSPIDLIPDFLPVLGYLDEVVLLPLGVALVIRLTPAPVLASARLRARRLDEKPVSYGAAILIVALWLALLAGAFWLPKPLVS